MTEDAHSEAKASEFLAGGTRPPMRKALSRAISWTAAALAAACFAGSVAISAGPSPPETTGHGRVQQGAYLATAGDCTACHSTPGRQPFAGGVSIQTPFGPVIASNITPSKTHGIGNYTEKQFADALRKGIRADGARLYPAMPYTAYAIMPDNDIKALYAYFMKGVAPVDTSAPTTKLPFPFNMRISMAAWNILFLRGGEFKADTGKSPEWNRGAYLAQGPEHCGTCHTPRNFLMGEKRSQFLAGADLGTYYAPNVTSDANSGIGGWSQADLVNYLRTGHAPGKAQAAGSMAEAIDYSLRHLTEADLQAIALYVRSVPAVHGKDDSRPPFAWGAPGNDLDSVRGVDLPADADKMTGPQLYDAYCSTCHNDSAQGTGDALPSLYHNTALGHANTNNLVSAILRGVVRHSATQDVRMPGFLNLSDRQVATLGSYLMIKYGNPAGTVTVDQVQRIRSGKQSSPLLLLARIAIGVGVLVVAGGILYLGFRRRRRRTATPR